MGNDKFQIAFNEAIAHEGGYSNHPSDPGGETYKGISRVMHPTWSGWDIIDFHKEQADRNQMNSVLADDAELQFYVTEFYYDVFWKPLKLDSFDQIVANELFDTAVNQGRTTAAKYLQQALNMLNNNQQHYSDLKIDGLIGDKTCKAYREYMVTAYFPGRSAVRNIHTLCKILNGLQFEKYLQIVENNLAQEVFLYGWINRV